MGTVQATPRVETLERLIAPPTLRVFCRSAFGRFHAVALDVLLLELLSPPQAATNRLVAKSKPTPVTHLPRRLIWGRRAFSIVFPFARSSAQWTKRSSIDLGRAEAVRRRPGGGSFSYR